MSDGPFKHMNLPGSLQKLLKQASIDAVDHEQLNGIATHTILEIILSDTNSALLKELMSKWNNKQQEIFPTDLIEVIFDRHPRNTFSENLKLALHDRLKTQEPYSAIFKSALIDALDYEINSTKQIIQHHCTLLRESENFQENYQMQLSQASSRVNKTLDELNRRELCDAIIEGDKAKYKDKTVKRTGVDQGPIF